MISWLSTKKTEFNDKDTTNIIATRQYEKAFEMIKEKFDSNNVRYKMFALQKRSLNFK